MYYYFQRESSVMRKGLNEHTFEALNLVDLITAINIENKFFDGLPELRCRVVSKWFYIIFSKIYSMKFKVGVILLAFMPSIFYRLFTATRLKGN